MATKIKGLLKGLRYISQIFDDEKKEQEIEIEIGYPTDVKHVAHIGSEGPSNSDAPSWLNEFKSETRLESTPMVSPASHRKDPRIKSTTEEIGFVDSRGKRAEDCQGRDLHEIPKSSRRNSSIDKSRSGSPKKKESKTKQSKRQNSKECLEGDVKSTRKLQETGMTSNSPSRNLPDIPKKSRGKKSKELVSGGGSAKSRSKGDASNGSCTFQYSEIGSGSDTILQTSNPPRLSPIPNLGGGGKEYR